MLYFPTERCLPLKPVRVTGPAVPLLSVADVARHTVIDFSEDNNLVALLIQAATDKLDGYSGIVGRCLINQTWRIDLPDWPFSTERLPFPDVSSIVSVKYYDTANAEQTLSPSTVYEVLEDARGSVLRFNDTFLAPNLYDDRLDAVKVTFVAGYGAAASDVPATLRLAAMQLVASWYGDREGRDDVPESVRSMIEPYCWKSY